MAARPTIDRRTALTAGAVGAGALVLAGCGASGVTCAVLAAGTARSQGGGQQLAVLADIAVGGAVLAGAEGCGTVVVARPTDASVVAFSAICPHKGVVVAPRVGQLHCPAHDALFNTTTGEVEQGPADRALTEVAVSVVDGRVRTA